MYVLCLINRADNQLDSSSVLADPGLVEVTCGLLTDLPSNLIEPPMTRDLGS